MQLMNARTNNVHMRTGLHKDCVKRQKMAKDTVRPRNSRIRVTKPRFIFPWIAHREIAGETCKTLNIIRFSSANNFHAQLVSMHTNI